MRNQPGLCARRVSEDTRLVSNIDIIMTLAEEHIMSCLAFGITTLFAAMSFDN